MLKRLKQIFNSTTELQRAAFEYSNLQMSWPSLKAKAPKGDGHPVLFLPGFLTSDTFTLPMRERVEEQGYKTYGWNNGFNLGFDEKTAGVLRARLQQVFEENGGQKVTLVGHSLGGVFARELAREFPEMVRGVVTLGTPFGQLDDPVGATSEHLDKIYRFFQPKGLHGTIDEIRERGLTPPPVPTTSLYSQDDGVINWTAALNPKAKEAENIEVTGSHLGMTMNALTLTVLLDRLAQQEGSWQPFDAKKYPHLYMPKGPANDDLPENPGWKKVDQQKLFKDKPPAA